MGKNRLLRAAWVLLLLVLLSTWWVCGLYARYTAEISGSDSARVAAFVFSSQGRDSAALDLSGIQKPGDSVTYTFTVTNQKGGAVSEVSERIGVSVQLNGSMPLTCTVFKDSGTILTAEITAAEQTLPVTETGYGDMLPAGTPQTDTYEMKVEWPAAENNIIYASRSAVAEAVLTVTAEQVD